ncbi:TolC family protein [Planctomycetota bacterium]
MCSNNRHILFVWWFVFAACGLWITGGCRSPENYKAEADEEVYNIIDGKWQDGFGEKVNYKISDSPPSPEDIQIPNSDGITGTLSLAYAVAIATANNRDYQAQKESLYTGALGLTSERHKYALQWFGTIDGEYTRDVDQEGNVYEDVSVGTGGGREGEIGAGVSKSHLLAGGIQISTSLAINWLRYLTGDPRTSLGSVLSSSLTVPLLGRGGGKVAWENLTQAERSVLYQIRSFNRYRKSFVVGVVDAYYSVLQQRETVINAQNNYARKVDSRERLEMEAETGRKAQFDVDEARQSELSARDSYVGAQRSYERALDNFKVAQLSFPTDTNIVLDPNELLALKEIGIAPPDYTLNLAIETALVYRLDLANTADRIDDQLRNVALAAEGLGPQLNLSGRTNVESRGKTDFSQLQFHEGTYSTGFDADLPFDRLNERNSYRSALINLTQQQRQYDNERDRIELNVSNSYRQLLETAERHSIQEMSLELAERRVQSNELLLDAGRGTVRVLLDSQDSLRDAQNAVTSALIAHTIAKLNFYKDIGVLQVKPDGMWEQKEWEITKTNTSELIQKANSIQQDL